MIVYSGTVLQNLRDCAVRGDGFVRYVKARSECVLEKDKLYTTPSLREAINWAILLSKKLETECPNNQGNLPLVISGKSDLSTLGYMSGSIPFTVSGIWTARRRFDLEQCRFSLSCLKQKPELFFREVSPTSPLELVLS